MFRKGDQGGQGFHGIFQSLGPNLFTRFTPLHFTPLHSTSLHDLRRMLAAWDTPTSSSSSSQQLMRWTTLSYSLFLRAEDCTFVRDASCSSRFRCMFWLPPVLMAWFQQHSFDWWMAGAWSSWLWTKVVSWIITEKQIQWNLHVLGLGWWIDGWREGRVTSSCSVLPRRRGWDDFNYEGGELSEVQVQTKRWGGWGLLPIRLFQDKVQET